MPKPSADSPATTPAQSRSSLLSELVPAVQDNLDHFTSALSRHNSASNWVFSNVFVKLLDHLDQVRSLSARVQKFAPDFDAGGNCPPGNGFRAILAVTDACLQKLLHLNRQVVLHRGDVLFFFRKSALLSEVGECADSLATLHAFLLFAIQLRSTLRAATIAAGANHTLLVPVKANGIVV